MPYENTIVLFRDSFGDFSYFAALVFALLNVHWFLQEEKRDAISNDWQMYKGISNFIYCCILISFYYTNGIVFILENEFYFFVFSCIISGLYGVLSITNHLSLTTKKKQLGRDSCLYSIAAIFSVLYRTIENPYALIFVFVFLLHFLLSCFVEMETLVKMAKTVDTVSKNQESMSNNLFEFFEKICIVLMIHWFLVFGFFPIFESNLSSVVYVEVGILATYSLCIYKQKKKSNV